jgi:hypothetical protein
MTKKHPHWGTTLDEFLAEDGIRESAECLDAPAGEPDFETADPPVAL